MNCRRCTEPTEAPSGYCDDCAQADTARERNAQGLPPVIADASSLRTISAVAA